MDLTTALGLAAGAAVVVTLILLGGDLRTFYDVHAIIVIFGGSQAVRRLNASVAAALPALVMRAVVIHLAGAEGIAEATANRAVLPAAEQARYRPAEFLGEDLLDALAAADLVVGRAGSSTLAEATAFGLPMVVIPYPHAGAHQHANAAAVATAGAATLIEDEDLDGPSLLDAVAILEEPARHAAMAAAARRWDARSAGVHTEQ